MRFSVAVLLCLVTAVVLAGQAPPGPQQPTFRAGVNLVRIDVFPTQGGHPVPDLTKADFQVLEDGVAQNVDSFEHVVVHARGAASERVEPRTVDESRRMAADPRNRLFVLFLDTFHVTDDMSPHNGWLPSSPTERQPAPKKPLGPARIDRALMNFLNRAVAPTDLFAPFTPEMDAAELTFTRRPDNFEELLRTVWGRRFDWSDLDPEEMRWALCYPPDDPHDCYHGVLEEMVGRRREAMTIASARRLVRRLGELREERKAVLLVSEGWALYRPNQQLARLLIQDTSNGCQPIGAAVDYVPKGKGVYVGSDGKPKTGTDPRSYVNADWQQCESARSSLAAMDDAGRYHDLMDEANGANASFYPVDPRGLAVFDTPIDAAAPGSPGLMRVESYRQLPARLESMRVLAAETDGRMTATNDIARALKGIADDLSDYYLLGYYSSNPKPDGRFRKITVRVTRPGVAVRARRGYLAPTEAEVALRRTAAAPLDPDLTSRDRALAALGDLGLNRPFHLSAGVMRAAGPETIGVWVIGELDVSAARDMAWSAGAQATISVSDADGGTLASQPASISSASRSFLLHLPLRVAPGDYVVRARVQAAAGTDGQASEQLRITVPAGSPASLAFLGDPRVFRRGPFSGPGFQPTADLRFRRAERIRVDVPVSASVSASDLAARLLDRKGQALAVPAAASVRDESGTRVASAEVALAPLGFGDYLVEVSVRRGDRQEKVLTALRLMQ